MDNDKISEQELQSLEEEAMYELLRQHIASQIPKWQASMDDLPAPPGQAGPTTAFTKKLFPHWAVGAVLLLLLLAGAVWLFWPDPEMPASTPSKVHNEPIALVPTYPQPQLGATKSNTDTSATETGKTAPKPAGDKNKKQILENKFKAIASAEVDAYVGNFRASSNDLNTPAERGENYLKEKKYKEAVDVLSAVSNPSMEELRMLVVAQIKLGQLTEAEKTVLEAANMPSDEKDWLILLCQLADYPNRHTAFDRRLNEIKADPEHPYFHKAKDLEIRLFRTPHGN